MVQVALRPEKFELLEEQPTSGSFVVGKMDKTAYLGERSHYYIHVDGKEEPIAVSTQNLARMNGAGAAPSGASMWLSWSPDAVVLLDAD